MRRHIGGSAEAFERLFLHAPAGAEDVENAAYPPACRPAIGPLRFRVTASGALRVEVEPRPLDCGDFLLRFLFGHGSCLFAAPADLRAFWNGSLADAFGISVKRDDAIKKAPSAAEPLFSDPDAPGVDAGARSRRTGRGATPAGSPSSVQLASALVRRVYGQDAAVGRVAAVVAAHFAKPKPQRPGTVCLLGPTGVGKTATVEALPASLAETGYDGASVHRIDCGELVTEGDMSRVLGTSPGYVGYNRTPPIYRAIRERGCILLLDEFEKAHEELQAVALALMDTGRIRTPAGEPTDCASAVVALTSNAATDELEALLHRTDPANVHAIDRISREHVRAQGWPSELVGRIGAFAVYGPLDEIALRPVAEQAIRDQAAEYGLQISMLEPVLADVVVDLAARSGAGARAFHYAARDLLSETLAEAARNGVRGSVSLTAGPPPHVAPVLQ